MLLAVPLPFPLKVSIPLEFAGVIPVQSKRSFHFVVSSSFFFFFCRSTQDLLRLMQAI